MNPNEVPTRFDGNSTVHTMDQRVPVGTHDGAPETLTQEQLDQRMVRVRAQAGRQATMRCLQSYLDAAVGDDMPTLQMRSAIQTLMLEAGSGTSDKSDADLLDEAAKLANVRTTALVAQGDGSGEREEVRTNSEVRRSGVPHNYFSMPDFLTTLTADLQGQGRNWGLETLGRHQDGPEMEFVRNLASQDRTKDLINRLLPQVELAARNSGAANPRTIPFPLNATAGVLPTHFAETYAESVVDGAQRREPTFRADMLVPFFRPTMVTRNLGVLMPVISNDQTLPILAGSIAATWLGETDPIPDSNLTIASRTTSPHRLGTMDEISWMNLAAANEQLAITPLVTMEMGRALGQAEEQAIFNGSGSSNQPTGLLATTGIGVQTITSNLPTHKNMLDIRLKLQNADIPDAEARYSITPSIATQLALTLRWPGTNAQGNRAIFEGQKQPMIPGQRMDGSQMGYIIEVPAFPTNNMPRALGAGNNMHALLYGIWRYIVCFQYSVAFLTIDDVSLARTAQTRITINKFVDVFVRLPSAFVTAQWIPQ